MRYGIVAAIYLKELRETLRDRRTLMFALVVPMLLYPLLIIGMSRFQESLDQQSRVRTARLTVLGEIPPGLREELRSRNFEVQPVDAAAKGLTDRLAKSEFQPFERMPDPEEPGAEKKREKLREASDSHPLLVAVRPIVLDRKTDLVLAFWPLAEKDGFWHAAILFDSVRQDSRRASTRLQSALDSFRRRMLAQRETDRGLAHGFTRGVEFASRDVAPRARRSGFGLGAVLPFLLLSITATAGFYRAVDATAGEKERNTMQTLLCAPVRSIEIVLGKFVAISTVTLLAAAANIASLGLTFANLSKMAPDMALSAVQYILVFLVLIPITLLSSALFLGVGVFARDFKDGQNLLTPVMMLTLLPAAVSMLPGVETNVYTLMAPVVNVVLLIKALLVGEAKADQIFLTLISSTAYAGLALAFAARVFERDALLTGGKDTFRGLFGLDSKRREITPSLSFTAFSVVLVLLFYGSVIPKLPVEYLLLVAEYGLILAPSILLVVLLRLPMARTLALRWPGWRPMLAGVLVGASGWTVASAFVRLLPPPESLRKALEKILLVDRADVPLYVVLFVAAITPALCEEIFFRGLLQGGFQKLGMWAAVLTTAVLFGVAHGSIYRMLPVTVLGVAFGLLAWHSRSVFPGVAAHAVNNGIFAVIAAYPPLRQWATEQKLLFIPWSWTAAGAVVLALGLYLAMRQRQVSTPAVINEERA
jgi:sodium transport system permease protein